MNDKRDDPNESYRDSIATVDKVYTNRLINYGKRLLYEFMVPEPARFYKLAIIVEAVEKRQRDRYWRYWPTRAVESTRITRK